MSSGLWGLFAGSFLAATLLPGGSELLYGALLLRGEDPPLALLAVATLGNTLGGLSSFAIGRWLRQRRPAESFAVRHERALTRLRHFGAPAWLSTRAAQDSYDLTVAKAQNQSLVDKRDSLKRTYESGDSAPELSDKAARLGLVPAGNTARLVVGERGRVSVRGKATAASGRAPRSINPKPVDDALRHIDTSKVDDSTGLPGTGADAAPPQAAQDGGQSADRAAGQAGAQPAPAQAAPNVLPPTPTSDGGAPGPNPRRTAQ